MRQKSLIVEIFAVSLAAILLEISYTRIFSFKVYYYFSYLIIGIALLGLGAGGVLVSISRRLREADPRRLIATSCTAAGVLVTAGYFAIAPAPLDVSGIAFHRVEVLKLALVVLVLLAPFLAAGIVLATILGLRAERVGILYGADLLGAAVACMAVVPLLVWLGPPGCVVLSGALFGLAGLPGALRTGGALAAAGGLVCTALVAVLVLHGALPDPVADEQKQIERFRESGLVLHSEWHPIFRVDATETPFRTGESVLLSHDGFLGSAIHRFDGDFSRLEPMRKGPPSVPFSATGPEPRVLIVGSAGGHEVLASLYFGASEVVGVELNPVTLRLLTQEFADFAGRLHEDPRVTLVHSEARSFLERSDERFDLIWLVAPDSYAAMNAASSAAFVLSESYLYTVEMLEACFEHLTPGGLVAAQFGERDYRRRPNRTARFVRTAREALAERGVGDPAEHVMVVTASGLPPLTNSTILVSPRPFDAEQRRRFTDHAGRLQGGAVRWVPGRPPNGSPVNRAIALPRGELEAWHRQHPYDLRPVRDDAPFFWHFTRFRDSLRFPVRPGTSGLDWEDTIGEQLMLVLLALATVFAAVFLLLPFAVDAATWARIPGKAPGAVYFAGLGLGFMFIEITLIQRFTLFLGYPTHSLSVTLFGLLVFSGVGSLWSERVAPRWRSALPSLLGVLAGLLALHWLATPVLFERLAGAPFAARVAVAVALIAPLGLCLGTFLPLGLHALAGATAHRREVVAWSWAVNGFFSVVGSILATILAMVLGFSLLLLVALGCYVLGVGSLARFAPAERPS